MTSITSLIERVEAATEGSRELDGDIALLVGWEPTHERSSSLKLAYTYPSFRERWKGDRRPFDNWNVPRYSTSIDAALTLLPLGYEYDLTNIYGVARVSVGLNCEPGPFYGANECGSVPLALLAAILRARQTEPHHDES